MTVEERIRAASVELHHATETRAVPPPRFAATSSRPPRRRLVLVGLALTASIAIIAAVALTGNDAPSKIDTTNSSTTTVNTTTQTDAGPGSTFPPPPQTLANYLGLPLGSIARTLERWGAVVELDADPSVQNMASGRIIGQEPGESTPFVAGMRVKFTIGSPTTLMQGEVELASGSGPGGAWRVIASTVFDPAVDGDSFMVAYLSDTKSMITGGTPEPTQVKRMEIGDPRMTIGTAPIDAVSIEIVDSTGAVVGSVPTKRIPGVTKPALSYWVIESGHEPAQGSLRAVDHSGNVLAGYPPGTPGK